MTAIGNRRSTTVMYSNALCIRSHIVRLVLAEKGIKADIQTVPSGVVDENLLGLNPHGALPTLIDRELVLYDSRVITDYLDERYPHPPMMPVDPVSRARTRLALYRIELDWYSCRPDAIDQKLTPEKACQQLSKSLSEAAEVFAALPFLFSEEYSILDATIAPLLWRLPAYGIVLPKSAAPVEQYAKRIFARPGFQASLSDAEREMAK